MKIIVQKTVINRMINALKRAGLNETKGACFASKTSDDCYSIEDVFLSKEKGTTVFSNLKINYSYKCFEKRYFKKHKYDYVNHNYIGDWHSHPSFDCLPSNYDKKEAFEELYNSNARFLIQLIVKLIDNEITGRCFLYLKNSIAEECELVFDK